MITRWKRFMAAAFLSLTLVALLSGCWDDRQLDEMSIITGVALDETDDSDQMDITLQIGGTKPTSSGSGEADSQADSIILLKTVSNTMMGGMMELNRDSSRKLLLHHNQVLLLGSPLAEQGVQKRIDLFMRDQQARMEVPVVVVEGRAEEALSAKLDQDKISGIFLSRMLDDLAAVSSEYRVRMLDFASRILDKTSSPVTPIIKVAEKDGKQEIKLAGMAVFKRDRMTGQLSNDETMGYIWSMGNVKQCGAVAETDLGKAVFHIAQLSCKRKVSLRKDGGVRVTLSAEATVSVSELSGFGEMSPDQLLPYLIEMAKEEIRRKITGSFEAARRLNADIYGFGTSVHQKYPGKWESMKDQWDEIFQDIELNVEVEVHLPATGQTIQNLEMEENKR